MDHGERDGLHPAAEPLGVVLVEGASDRAAVEALARRRGRDLAAEGIAVVAMGGVTNIGHELRRFGPAGLDVRLGGLYDAGEEHHVRRALERAGIGVDLDRPAIAALGFHVCEADLEDELIRALGPDAVEHVIAESGEARALRTFRRQPAQRGRPPAAQLRRFLGTISGRKVHYAAALVDALDLDHVPRPLDLVV